MSVEEELASLKRRVEDLERVKRGLVARLELLDSAVNVQRHGKDQLFEENRRIRRALNNASMNLASLGVMIALLSEEKAPSQEELAEIRSLVELVTEMVERGLRPPVQEMKGEDDPT